MLDILVGSDWATDEYGRVGLEERERREREGGRRADYERGTEVRLQRNSASESSSSSPSHSPLAADYVVLAFAVSSQSRYSRSTVSFFSIVSPLSSCSFSRSTSSPPHRDSSPTGSFCPASCRAIPLSFLF